MRHSSIFLAFSVLCMTQCSSLSIEECTHSDWFSLGLADGNRGTSTEQLNQYQKDCREFNLNVDTAQWKQGYLQGLANYCQPENGYRIGLAGQSYYSVCSSNEFVARYNQGHQQYQINKRMADIVERLNSIDREISSIDGKLNNLTDKASLLKQKNSLLNEKNQLLDEGYRLRRPDMRFEFRY